MNTDERLTLALSALWILLAIPVSEQVYDRVLSSGFLMRIFALAVVTYPVWLLYGWRWVTKGAPLPKKLIALVLAAGIVLTIYFADQYSNSGWYAIAYVPILSAVAFAALVWVSNGRAKLPSGPATKPKVQPKIAPDKLRAIQEIDNKASPLLTLTQNHANELLNYMNSLPGRPSPIISAPADAISAVYGLLYLNFSSKHMNSNRSSMMFAMYQSHVITNVLHQRLSIMPGPKAVDPLNNRTLREPTRNLLRLQEDYAERTLANLASDERHPFRPLYENYRCYLRAGASVDDLDEAFSQKFADLNNRIGRQVHTVFVDTAGEVQA